MSVKIFVKSTVKVFKHDNNVYGPYGMVSSLVSFYNEFSLWISDMVPA
jgi:hypothetical protein